MMEVFVFPHTHSSPPLIFLDAEFLFACKEVSYLAKSKLLSPRHVGYFSTLSAYSGFAWNKLICRFTHIT